MTEYANIRVTIKSDGVESALPDHPHVSFSFALEATTPAPTPPHKPIVVGADGTIDLAGVGGADALFTFTLDSPLRWGGHDYRLSFAPTKREGTKGRENFVIGEKNALGPCTSATAKTPWSLTNRQFNDFMVGTLAPTLSVRFANKQVNGKAADYCYGLTVFVYKDDFAMRPLSTIKLDPQIKNSGSNGLIYTIWNIDAIYFLAVPLLVGAYFAARPVIRRLFR